MNTKIIAFATAAALAASVSTPVFAASDKKQEREQSRQSRADSAATEGSTLNQTIASWPERPRLAALQMMGKYGEPKEVTSEKIVWHEAGPFKRITVTKMETPHNFPLPHMDFLEHTIPYDVPADKADEITEFDGSVTVDRTAGELSAKCDLENHNILSLNLANDIATGKKSVRAARKDFGENVVQELMGQPPAYVTALQFKPAASAMAAGDPDEPVIPGSPKRATAQGDNLTPTGRSAMGDGEVLGFVTAVNMNEIHAAMAAQKKEVSPEVMNYAKMLHKEHGKNMGETMKVGEKIDTAPMITKAVDQLQVKGAGELAAIVPLEGEEFGRAYMQAMVKGHQEALTMIDDRLMSAAQHDELKQHLTKTRGHIAQHLEQAQQIVSGMR